MSEQQQIVIENIRDCFVQIPWLVDDADLDVYEFRLLVHYYRVGNCWENTGTTAKACHMSRPQAIEKRKSLAMKGWINIKAGGAQDSLTITVVDKWSENHQKYSKKLDTPTYGGKRPDKGGHVVDPKYIDIKNIQSLKDSGENHAASPDSRYVPFGEEFEDTKPKTAKQKRAERDAILDHPALKTYRSIAHLNVDFTWRHKVANTVTADPARVKMWEQLITDWIGSGWNKANIKGMLEAFQNGGINQRGKPAKKYNAAETRRKSLEAVRNADG